MAISPHVRLADFKLDILKMIDITAVMSMWGLNPGNKSSAKSHARFPGRV
jgi:hypothetical protein